MAAMIIDGNKVAETMRAEMRQELIKLKAEHGLVPGLAVVLVGDNPASQVYVRNKKKSCEDIGIKSLEYKYPADFSEEQLLKLIKDLNEDPQVNGILVQLPLPKHINETNVLYAIDPRKDVDGFHPVNVGKLMIGEPDFLPCTPWGCQQLLIRSGCDPAGKHVVVVGRSNIVGKPVAMILIQKATGANATVTICHTGTKNMAEITRQADILIAAVGRPEMITGDMVKEGVVVIDVGVNRVDDPSKKTGYKLVGDVHFDSVKEKASAITPVPGGVGPMTITMLLANTIRSAKRTLK
ncbi:MAG: bifunctional methylenetetrahydrofolate dehydrogenase/methenyltetrahydrofolate cyclohydrolase FolD [Candidatus Tectomicrobia bacterium]|uniref:Bifunctional protein FolD n=1 Tax=Tectimicrobiota bacterium TaxID=2528274 RepID=A0A933GKB0_UNCTE|nr:bifunctional methylenetetrahydrofolate dehydrogenase/methenyltetrahydrofolate cyclohydrolase FolD [Candidatus Tectomicrobia bacterium]